MRESGEAVVAVAEVRAGDYEWATICLNCGDGPRRHPSEADARRCHAEDVRSERKEPESRRHRLRLLRRPTAWEDVTPDD